MSEAPHVFGPPLRYRTQPYYRATPYQTYHNRLSILSDHTDTIPYPTTETQEVIGPNFFIFSLATGLAESYNIDREYGTSAFTIGARK